MDIADASSDRMDPFQLAGPTLSKPFGRSRPRGVLVRVWELALAGDVIVAEQATKLDQPEAQRGIFAFGGGSVRWPLRVGWGNAQRYLLTGDLLDAQEAWRIGLVQEVVPQGAARDGAAVLATVIASSAPLGVRSTLASRQGLRSGSRRAAKGFDPPRGDGNPTLFDHGPPLDWAINTV
ncbi:hypothetical protein MINTM021_09990 [Mycobacterium paraintracellulare]|nr:hypothetical protein MINTM021_09990 [Mycobacterium paraintracellulare]